MANLAKYDGDPKSAAWQSEIIRGKVSCPNLLCSCPQNNTFCCEKEGEYRCPYCGIAFFAYYANGELEDASKWYLCY